MVKHKLQNSFQQAFYEQNQLGNAENSLNQQFMRVRKTVQNGGELTELVVEEYTKALENFQAGLESFNSSVKKLDQAVSEHDFGAANCKDDVETLNEVIAEIEENYTQLNQRYAAAINRENPDLESLSSDIEVLRERIQQKIQQENRTYTPEFIDSLKIRDVTATGNTLESIWFMIKFTISKMTQEYREQKKRQRQVQQQ